MELLRQKVVRIISTSIAIGAGISALLLLMSKLSDDAMIWLDLQSAGITAAYIFGGAIGDSATVGMFVAWVVNTVLYALLALAVRGIFLLMKRVATA